MRKELLAGPRAGLLPALFAVMVLASGCDSVDGPAESAAPSSEVLAALSADLVEAVPLSKAAEGQLNGVLRRHQERVEAPGFLWYVAEGLQKTLSEEQKAKMLALFDRYLEEGFGHGRRGHGMGEGFGAGPAGGFGGPPDVGDDGVPEGMWGGGPMGPLRLIADLLTDEQKEQLKALQASHQEQVRAVVQSVRSGELTREEAQERIKALRDALKAEVEALLTAEQKAALEERMEERKEEREERREQAIAARNDALGLTAEEAAAMDALIEAHREASRDVLESVRDGSMDRDAAQEALVALRKSHFEELGALLSEDQLEIVKIHHVLRFRWARIQQAREKAGRAAGASFGIGPFGRR